MIASLLATTYLVVSVAATAFPASWFGGPIIKNPRVYPVYIGSFEYKTQVEKFLTAYMKSQSFGGLNQYNINSTMKIGYGAFDRGYNATFCPESSKTPCGTVTAAQSSLDIQKLLSNFFQKSTQGPYPGPTQIYTLFFGKEYDAAFYNCQGYISYHGYMLYGGSNVPVWYSVHPHCAVTKNSCSTNPVSALTCALSHEIIETVTNPMAPNLSAWGTSTASNPLIEIADEICDHQGASFSDSTGTYVAQKYWSNADKACVLVPTKYTPPPYVPPPPLPSPSPSPSPVAIMPYIGEGNHACGTPWPRPPTLVADVNGVTKYCFANAMNDVGTVGYMTYDACSAWDVDCNTSFAACDESGYPCCIGWSAFDPYNCNMS
ncbi:UNVERIFIED_CONTAM: hypothetical protein HDU68_005122 [Siphonaria sp. JEL0065]|nr:hypothetical protein HDU68_005122 [Siphonaria sp. JEL0065]